MTTKPHQTKTKLKKAHSYTNLNYFFSSFGKLQKPTFTHRLIHYCTHTFSIGLVSTLIWAQPAPVVLVLMIKSSRLDKWMGLNALQIVHGSVQKGICLVTAILSYYLSRKGSRKSKWWTTHSNQTCLHHRVLKPQEMFDCTFVNANSFENHFYSFFLLC